MAHRAVTESGDSVSDVKQNNDDCLNEWNEKLGVKCHGRCITRRKINSFAHVAINISSITVAKPIWTKKKLIQSSFYALFAHLHLRDVSAKQFATAATMLMQYKQLSIKIIIIGIFLAALQRLALFYFPSSPRTLLIRLRFGDSGEAIYRYCQYSWYRSRRHVYTWLTGRLEEKKLYKTNQKKLLKSHMTQCLQNT